MTELVPLEPDDITPGPVPWPQPWIPVFLATLRGCANVREACLRAGVTRATALSLRGAFQRFRLAWDEALEDAVDQLEGEAWNRAMSASSRGSDQLLWNLLKARRRSVYGDRLDITVKAQQAAELLGTTYKLDPADILAKAEELATGKLSLPEPVAPPEVKTP